MSSEDNGFLSRWSRRKAMVRSGQPLPPDPLPAASQPPAPISALAQPEPEPPEVSEPLVNEAPQQPVPTLDDVADLTPQSDFKPFVARHVPADVRNAAVKKLFADPHFNVMDGLDIYIDDYTKSEPIPADMLAKMVGAQFLKLVDEPKAAETPAPSTQPQAVAPPTEQPQEAHDDHPDLQLQPDHAPGPQSPGAGTG